MKTNKARKTIFTSISVLALVLMTVVFGISLHAQTIIIGDMNNDSEVNEDDAAYLLRHVLLPSKYPIDQSGDLNGDGKVNVDDALYLSKHITGPDEYPLTCHHSFGEWTQTKAPTCTEKGEEKRTCTICGSSETRDVAVLGHNEVSHAAKAPTCTEIGWDAYVTCSRCDYTTYVERMALGHDEVSHDAKAPTCTEIGWSAYVTCSRCDYTTYAERPALGHEYVDGVCKNCGQEIQPSKGLEYTLNSDRKSYYVSGIGSCKDTDIVIPSTYNGKPVTSIGNYAFRVCSKLTSITIGKSVMSIGLGAFSGCSSLTSIEIPDSVTSIGDSAFIGCSSLTSITIPDSVTSISGRAFSGCSSLTSITVVSGNPVYHSAGNCLIETSSRTLVAGCKNSIIPNDGSVTSIGDYAFYGCDNLTSITIPEGVTGIGFGAFRGCSSLMSITIPDSVTSIGDEAFEGCSSLTSVTIGNGVISIGYCAFYYCSSLTSITIPDSVTSIGDRAFYECSSLTGVIIGNGVTSIGSEAFYSCDSLTSVTIGNGVTSIGRYAFKLCSSLTSIVIPNSVTSIYYGAFEYSSLTSITVVSGNPVYHSAGNCLIETSSKTLIAGCKNSIIPNDGSVTSIGNYAFEECSSLTSINIPNGVTSIGWSAFEGCSGLTSIVIPNSVTSIGYRAFDGCSSLTSITIGNSVTSIDDGAFRGCSSLTSIEIPESVTSIGDDAFYNCRSLTSITIPDSVTSIGRYAFQYCYKLAEVYNLSSLSITKGSSGNGYVGYYALVVHTSADEPANVFTDENGYVFYENGDTCYLLGYKGTDTALTLPENCNGKNYGIYEYAFYGCRSLTSITIPDSVTSIGSSAFYNCDNLTSIEIPDSVKNIGQSAFSDCSGLTSITIPDSVTSIGNGAFQYCRKLVEVYNLSSLNITKGSSDNGYVGYYALVVHTSADEPANVFTDENGYIFYENGDVCYLLGYKGTDTALILPENCNGKNYSIYEYAFSWCSSLTSIEIPNSVTSIGRYAFQRCTGLTSINFNGTKAQWNAISKGIGWNNYTGSYKIYCTDGTISK